MPYDAASVPPPHAVVRSNVSVTVPEVVTTASDGFAALKPGTRRWSVPVLLTVGSAERTAWLEVSGASCPPVDLLPGTVVRLSCTALVTPHSTVTVRLQTAEGGVASWDHTVR